MDPTNALKTLLFTDIEGSTELWEHDPAAMERAVLWHQDQIAEHVEQRGGRVVTLMGDGVYAAFEDSTAAVFAAIDSQKVIWARTWSGIGRLAVRMGLHAGVCRCFHNEIYGRPVNLAARVAQSAHGGQIVATDPVAEQSSDQLRPGERFASLGSHRFRGITEAVGVHALLVPGLHSAFPPLIHNDLGLADLPSERGPLIGRNTIVATVLDVIRARRLVSLVGPGGVGKSRIAVRVASRSGRPFVDGIRYIDLSAARDDNDVAAVITSALRLHRRQSESDSDVLRRVLGPARALIVLDGCETVASGVREIVSALLRSCPGVHVLLTSRLPLELHDERVIPVDPLDVPRPGCSEPRELMTSDAVALFVERAEATDPGFALDHVNSPLIAELCRIVGGMPLAVELAAARVDVEEPSTMIGDGESLIDRLFDSRTPAAARTVGETFNWSLRHVSPAARTIFGHLSVFRGAFTREMAVGLVNWPDRAVAHSAVDELTRCALILRTTPDRLKLLDTARSAAAELVSADTWADLQTRHAELMLVRAETTGPLIRTAHEAEAVQTLSQEFPDFRAAMEYFMETGRWDEAARLVIAIFQFTHFQPLSESIDWAIKISTHINVEHRLAPQVYGAAALGRWHRGDYLGALEAGECAVRAAAAQPDGSELFWARLATINSLVYLGRDAETEQHFRAFIAESRESKELFWQINGLGYEAIGFLMYGLHERARARVDEALARARNFGNPDCLHWALHRLGRYLSQSDPEEARRAFLSAADASRRVDSSWNVSLNLIEVVGLDRRLGDRDAATVRLLELTGLLHASGNRSQLGQAVLEAAHLLNQFGVVETAGVLLCAARALPGMPRTRAQAMEAEHLHDQLIEALGPRWHSVTVTAASLTEAELFIRCRDALERLARHGDYRSAPADAGA